MLVFSISGCKDDDKLLFESITDIAGTAGGLRTIAILSPNFNYLDLDNSEFSVEVEEWDNLDGGLLQSVDVFASFNDNSPENGDRSVPSTLVKNIAASNFTVNSYSGLPRATISLQATEAINALGLDKDNDILYNDSFRIFLTLNLTDGTKFSYNNLEGNITGPFFNSPFTYPIEFSCPIDDASLFQGTYIVTRDDWADYAVGTEIPVVLGDDPFTFRLLSVNNPYISNPDTSYMEFTINPDDSSVAVTSNECFDYGPGFCLNVTGTGTIGSCTGAINVTINFGPYAGYVFQLSKK